MTTWQILVPTIPHRHEKLCALLEVLDAQMRPGVSVLLYRDNLQASYPAKMQALMDAATAEYVSTLSDDDSVSPDFVPRVLAALESSPDQVGFRVRYTEAGVLQSPVTHSLRCGGWYEDGTGFYRDIMHFNPIRRELARQVRFRGLVCDVEFAADLRALGIIRTEVFIDDEIFYYMRDSADNFHTLVLRQPLPDEAVPPLPFYPWCVPLKVVVP
jgi:glycosyl transferase family 2